MKRQRIFAILLLASIWLLAGCSSGGPGSQNDSAATPSATIPIPTATPTPLPAAALVNGEGILLSDYQADLKRLEEAETGLNKISTPEERTRIVLDNLIGQTLLSQQAFQEGFVLEDSALEEEIQQLAADSGGAEALADWQKRMGYTDESLRTTLRRSEAAAWQRDRIIEKVPETGEQIHARQILVFEEGIADQIYTQLQGGAEFKENAWLYDPITGGDLGWFPRGVLLLPEIEAAVFTLQPGQFTPVIQTGYGFHIVEVIAREPDRPLDPDARRTLQQLALKEWVKTKREQSDIEIRVP